MTRHDLDEQVASLRDEADPRRRRLLALGLLTAQLAPLGIEPVLVGGGALEFYTAGGYATDDMDLALPRGPDVDAAFAALGFTKEGRFWYHADLDLVFEAPAPAGLPGEDAPRTEVSVDGLRVVILGVEDLLGPVNTTCRNRDIVPGWSSPKRSTHASSRVSRGSVAMSACRTCRC